MPLCSLSQSTHHHFYPTAAIGFTPQESYPHSLPVSTLQQHSATDFFWKEKKFVIVRHTKLDNVSEEEEEEEEEASLKLRRRRRRPSSSVALLPMLMETILEEEDE
ncbi:hypothetical protein O0I10_008644 [Lichtheimia ornata]|uniref:Uncharacterized protein n=1 Tax=Lichtheimia ornata TaxID=688661 RepID=A0AAD7UY31_9FUNG|nr:uncharacterized protein O0I10_008644 [Lichtheimia ornata]KAJ8655758.1 hypothetical protein O0I10_008644 [Lichtheimia ornata]